MGVFKHIELHFVISFEMSLPEIGGSEGTHYLLRRSMDLFLLG